MTGRRLLLGVDGGNTKTIALVATPDGEIVGFGRSEGPSDIYAVPVDLAIERIEAAVDAALSEAGEGSVAASAFSLAGADWPEDHELLRDRLCRRWPEPLVVNDAIGALRAAIPDGPGVVVVCGTGAATAARGTHNRTWHSSFWQESQGAHELGVRTVQAVARAALGIDGPTDLTAAVLAATGVPDAESLLHRFTGRETRRGFDPAALAPVLLDTAEGGDATARAIVRAQGEALGRMALAAARRVGLRDAPFALALGGGVIRHHGRLLADALVATVVATAPATTLLRPSFEPAVGALLLAFDRARVQVDTGVDARLGASLPPPDRFDTHPRRAATQ